MDRENVITLTDDPYALDTDMQNWEAMTFPMRKKSDDACIAKYGVTNIQLYDLLKEIIQDKEAENEKEKSVSEATASDVTMYKIDQINRSKDVQESTGEVIIDDWIGASPSPSYGDYLQSKYNAYLALPNDLKTMSNESSLAIWGYTVPNMYDIMLNKWETWKNMTPESIIHPETLRDLASSVKEAVTEGDDLLYPLLRKLDIVSYTEGTLYENAVLEDLVQDIDNCRYNMCDYKSDVPSVTPWFTPDEMKDIFGKEVDPYQYILGNDPKEFNQKIKDAVGKGDTDEIISLGWNPSVPYTAESASYARERQIEWFNENKRVEIVDLSNFDVVTEDTVKPIVKLEPVYLTLIAHEGINSKAIRFVTRSDYSHAGISFDSSLNTIYSFNASTPEGLAGLSVENLKFYEEAKNPKLKVMCIFVEPEVKNKMKGVVEGYLKNKDKTFYDWSDLFRILLKKSKDTLYSLGMICSQFVDTVLKACNIDITGKPSNLVTPKDIDMISKKSNIDTRVFILYTGPVKYYNQKKVDQKVVTIVSRAKNLSDLLTVPLQEALDMIFSKRDINGLYVTTDNQEANKVLNEIRELITPTAVLVEAKRTPVGVSKKGDVYIDLPKDPEEEYQQAHTLLSSYNASNIEGIKHQLARLYGLDIEIRKRIKKAKNNDKDYQEMVNLRARVLNDFYKYMGIVMETEPDFDFWWYFTASEYYNKTIKITKPTLKYSGKAIKSIAGLASKLGLPYPIKKSTLGKV